MKKIRAGAFGKKIGDGELLTLRLMVFYSSNLRAEIEKVFEDVFHAKFPKCFVVETKGKGNKVKDISELIFNYEPPKSNVTSNEIRQKIEICKQVMWERIKNYYGARSAINSRIEAIANIYEYKNVLMPYINAFKPLTIEAYQNKKRMKKTIVSKNEKGNSGTEKSKPRNTAAGI